MKDIESRHRIEWQTLGLIGLCTVLVLLVTLLSAALTLWVSLPILVLLLALHSSLQHEVLHGHPFKNKTLNEALVFVPLGIFLPYRRFKDTHIQHHFDPNLTDPYDDPETNFQDPEVWATLTPPTRLFLRLNNSLLGRMVLGPLISFYVFYRDDLKAMRAGERRIINAYMLHLIGLIPVVFWLLTLNTMPIWAVFLAAYGAISILKIRTFLEHRAHEQSGARSVIIEDRGLLAFLFLNNNYHAVHHCYPKLAWYHLPKVYAQNKAKFLAENGNYTYQNYRVIFQNYFFKPKDKVPHPLWNKSNRKS